MIEKIMSKLGMVVLWCIVIIYGIGVITHICSDIFGVVVLVVLLRQNKKAKIKC